MCFVTSTARRYVPVAIIRKTKNVAGRRSNPSGAARGVNGKTVPIATVASTVAERGLLGGLRNGLLAVRMTNRTNVCVASDSTNQPVRIR